MCCCCCRDKKWACSNSLCFLLTFNKSSILSNLVVFVKDLVDLFTYLLQVFQNMQGSTGHWLVPMHASSGPNDLTAQTESHSGQLQQQVKTMAESAKDIKLAKSAVRVWLDKVSMST